MSALARPVPRDVYEEHLEEASFLWQGWETALRAANYTLAEVVAGPEERLAAHLDALVLGGRPIAETILLPALETGDVDLASPSAWALLQGEDANHVEAVLAALAGAEPPVARAIARAIGLSSHPEVGARLSAFWLHGSPSLRKMILDVIARRDLDWAATVLPETLRANDPGLLAVGLRLVRRLADSDNMFARSIDDGLGNADHQVRDEAMASAFVRGNEAVWPVCRRAVAERSASLASFALLALSPDDRDRKLLRGCLDNPQTVRSALWALGFAGDVESADAVAAWLPDEALGALAGEAFSAMTGLAIAGPFRALAVGEDEVGPDDPPPVIRPEDHLPSPSPPAVNEWWQTNRGRFLPRRRYVGGMPRTAEALRDAAIGAPMWRRPVLALEIAAMTDRVFTVDPTGWGRAQLSVATAGPVKLGGVRRR